MCNECNYNYRERSVRLSAHMAHLKNKHQRFIPKNVNRQNSYMTYIPRLIEESRRKRESKRRRPQGTDKRRNNRPDMQECVGLEVKIPANLLNFVGFFFIICVFKVELFFFSRRECGLLNGFIFFFTI